MILQVLFHALLFVFSGLLSVQGFCLALESCGTGVLTGVIVLAVYVSQIND